MNIVNQSSLHGLHLHFFLPTQKQFSSLSSSCMTYWHIAQ